MEDDGQDSLGGFHVPDGNEPDRNFPPHEMPQQPTQHAAIPRAAPEARAPGGEGSQSAAQGPEETDNAPGTRARGRGDEHHGGRRPDQRVDRRAGRDPGDFSKLLERVADVYQTIFGEAPPLPRFVITGERSSGKSTTVMRQLGFPMNVIREGPGSACPHIFYLYQDPDAVVPRVQLVGFAEVNSGDWMDWQTAQKIIAKHNADLLDNQGFSSEAVTINFWSSTVTNSIFVDLPGYEKNNRAQRDLIKGIVMKEVTKENAIPVAVVAGSTQGFVNADAINMLSELPNWSTHGIVLVNRFDNALKSLTSLGAQVAYMNEFMNGHCPERVFFMTTPPPTYFDSDTEGDEKDQTIIKMISDAPRAEGAVFEALFATMRSKGHNANVPILEPQCGFAKFRNHMTSFLGEQLLLSLPGVLQRLLRENASITATRNRITQELQFLDPDHVRSCARGLMEMHRAMQLQLSEGLSGKITPGMTLLEEIAECESYKSESDWDGEMAGEQSSACQGPVQGEAMPDFVCKSIYANEKMAFGTAINRFLQYTRYQLISAGIPNDPDLDNEIMSSLYPYGIEQYNWEGALLVIVRDTIKKNVVPALNAMAAHCAFLMDRLITACAAAAQESNDAFRLTDWIVQKCQESVHDIMRKTLLTMRNAIRPFQQFIHPHILMAAQVNTEPTEGANGSADIFAAAKHGLLNCKLKVSDAINEDAINEVFKEWKTKAHSYIAVMLEYLFPMFRFHISESVRQIPDVVLAIGAIEIKDSALNPEQKQRLETRLWNSDAMLTKLNESIAVLKGAQRDANS